MRLNRITAGLGAVVWGATAAIAFSWPASPVAAGEPGCENDPNPQTCHAGAGQPATVDRVDLSSEVRGSAKSSPLMCPRPPLEDQEARWENIGPDDEGNYRLPDFAPQDQPNPQSDYWLAWCPYHINSWQDPTGINHVGGGWSNTGGPPPQPPNAASVQAALWAEVQGRLHNPAITLEPSQGVNSIVHIPTFVEIDNPQPSTLYTATVGAVYVWIAVIPTNTLHPGETGAGAVACDADGTPYDPNGPSVRAQAAAAVRNCVYTYTKRSPSWTGDVTINWAVTWGSNQPQQFGTLTAAPNVGTFTRIVGEMPGVLTKAGE